VARLGGDEFVVLLSETASETAAKVVNRIKEELLKVMKDNNWPVTFSFGVATFDNPPESVEEMLKHADELMFEAKNDGRNLVRQEEFR